MRCVLLGLTLLVGSSCAKQKSSYQIPGSADLSPRHDGPYTKVRGKLDVLDKIDKKLRITGTITDLPPGNYVAHIHGHNGCLPPAEGHAADAHHSDLGVITADASGVAKINITTPGQLGTTDPMTGYCILVYPPDLSTYVVSGKILTGGFVGH